MVKIGHTTKALSFRNWYNELDKCKSRVIEISGRSARLYFMEHWLSSIRPFLGGFDVSLHSRTTRVFSENPVFTDAELAVLRAEVGACRVLGIREMVFHLSNDLLTDGQASRLNDIFGFAKKCGVEMFYESNGRLDAALALDFLRRFPDINYNLDLGHLNVGIAKGSVPDLDAFLDAIRERTVYVHAHGNDGSRDQHGALAEGSLDWRYVLGKLPYVRKVLSETSDLGVDEENMKLLEEFYSP